MLFRRITCHYCGARSAHSKSSGLPQFQCTSCEAVNYLDSKGNITDPPADAVQPTQQYSTANDSRSSKPYTLRNVETTDQQRDRVFCDRCLQNQQILAEIIAGYLPDEDDPRYKTFEDALPRFREELEQKYPQVCAKCAPNVQRRMNRADYFGLTQNVALASNKGKMRGSSPARRRDSWDKWVMRRVTGLIESVLFFSMLIQSAWHAYGIIDIIVNGKPSGWEAFQSSDLGARPSSQDCARQAFGMIFSTACYDMLASLVPQALVASAVFVWYNPGMRQWYHHTKRIQAVEGQGDHFKVQAIITACRAVAFLSLRNIAVSPLDTLQLLAAHGFAILIILVGHALSRRIIEVVPWKMQYNKATPRPEETNIFAGAAGPADDNPTPQASSAAPYSLFRDKIRPPFPIENLAPQGRQTGFAGSSSRKSRFGGTPPSPPASDTTVDDGDAMEIDWQSSAQPQTQSVTSQPYNTRSRQQPVHSTYSHSTQPSTGWGALRDETFRIQDGVRASDEQRRREQMGKLRFEPPVEKSPFRGRLPPAPMSMERRLRNPTTQVQFKKTPLTKQQDFMKQMRNGIDEAKTFTRSTKSEKSVRFSDQVGGGALTDDEDMSPAKSRTRGQLELRDSAWRLPSDHNTATGLEDLFTGSFNLSDEPQFASIPATNQQPSRWTKLRSTHVALLVVALAGIAWQVPEIRRPVALWLVRQLEAYGI